MKTVVYVAGISGKVFAFEAETGNVLWIYQIKNFVESKKSVYVFQGTFLCPNGVTATPAIDRSTETLYVLGPDGMLYGLDLGSGRLRYSPIQFVAPFSKTWSLSLVDGKSYTTLSQGCGNGLSGFYSLDVRDPHRPVIEQGLLSNTNTAGIWGRGGPVIGMNGRMYGGTGDGGFNPAAGDYSNTVVAASIDSLKVVDYFLPPNWSYLNRKDFDLGSASPVFFGWRNRYLLAHGAKEGVIYLMDADSLGLKIIKPHCTHRRAWETMQRNAARDWGYGADCRRLGMKMGRLGSTCPWADRRPQLGPSSRLQMATQARAALWRSGWLRPRIHRIRHSSRHGFQAGSRHQNPL